MELHDSFELFTALEKLKLLENSPSLWWPAYGTYEVVIGALLTQNTQWSRVEVSLENLRNQNLLSIDAMAKIQPETLMELIRPSGFFKAKAKNLILLAENILDRFGDFETFSLEVDRHWLLKQKGIGPETADSILCYACKRAVMVVDAYTARLLNAFGYEFEHYDELQEWCETGLRDAFDDAQLSHRFAHFHGMIVEYVKRYSKSKEVEITKLSSMMGQV